MKTYFTSESVTEGHPDKICDQVSDALLDDLLKQDKNARTGIECMAGAGFIMVTGEVSTTGWSNVQAIVRHTLKNIGYTNSDLGLDYKSCAVQEAINEQSPDISQGVTATERHAQGAGDQGMMFGYACLETPELMPLPITLAHAFTKRLAEVRKKGTLPYLGPDGKSQVTVEYCNGKPKQINAIVIAAQHSQDTKRAALQRDIKKHVIAPVLERYQASVKTSLRNIKLHINETGRFVIGGPQADAGLTGRKIIVDTYGGMGRHGGGAFSGKDPSKVDRSGAYMARYIAKNVVSAGLAERCELQVSYAIGVAYPVSVRVETFDTGAVSEERIAEAVVDLFDMRPASMIKTLNLKRPLYLQTAVYGHFGRNDLDLPWEQVDMVSKLKRAV